MDKDLLNIFLEQTTTSALPSGVVGGITQLPGPIVNCWNKYLDYSYNMKRKFGYFPVTMKDKSFTRGHKGQLTKHELNLKTTIIQHKLDVDKTVLDLFRLYPPKFIG